MKMESKCGGKPLVSVIIPCYRQAEYLPEALDSVMAQTYAEWEAIVVDDGSPDDTAGVAGRYAGADGRIRLVRTENGGVSAARNVGLREARGLYVVALDADDRIAPQYLERLVEAFGTGRGADVAYCRWAFFGTASRAPELRYLGYGRLLVNNAIFSSAMYRREDALRIGGYDEQMRTGYEDWEFFLRLLNERSRVVQLPEVMFFYRIKEVSRNTQANEREAEINFYIYKKHIDKYRRHYGDPIAVYRDYASRGAEREFKAAKDSMKRSPGRAAAWLVARRYVGGGATPGRKAALLLKFAGYWLLR